MDRAYDTEVLVVGAGPTGLAHALWLARAGVRVRIIDQTAEPGTTSRAVGVAARTLELYRQLGLADEVVAAGWPAPAVNLWVRGELAGRADLGAMGEGLSPYPYELMFSQSEHERLLIRALAATGVRVERPRALASFTQDDAGVDARFDDGSTCRAAYLAGCDGAHSIVREALAIGLPGGTYEQQFFVADLEGSGRGLDGELHVALDTSQFLAAFPLARGRARVVSTTRGLEHPRWDDVAADVSARLGLEISQVHDFSTYRVHHRVANRFRVERAFLLGDAAHLHSPAGAQGMNTGIGDAVNLAWKLDAVLGGGPPSLLDSYEPERRGFARRLVATTDRVFQLATHDGAIARFVRTRIAPRLVEAAMRARWSRRAAFRLVSQLAIAYRDSALSDGQAGEVHAGDRLPWVPGAAGAPDNFAPLVTRAWQLHVYGAAPAALRASAATAAIPLHEFAYSEAARTAGLARDAAYLIRPDGYVACARAGDGVTQVTSYPYVSVKRDKCDTVPRIRDRAFPSRAR